MADLKVSFFQGQDDLLVDASDEKSAVDIVKSKINDLVSIKNLHFLLGSGASADAIPSMDGMLAQVESKLGQDEHKDKQSRFEEIKKTSGSNLEEVLSVLYSHKSYLEGAGQDEDAITSGLINLVEEEMYHQINIDLDGDDAQKALGLYQTFYHKLSLRNKDLARVNVFTTNNDLLSEKSLDYLNINYNNGFGGGLSRYFNPARYSYTYSRKVDANLEKYEPLENMVYLFKLHGSINWIECEGNSFFNIREVEIEGSTDRPDKNVLIYPTPLKQNKSLGSPYADIIREFQKRLLLKHSVLVVIGYSFSDEHINNMLYQALASNSSLSVLILGDYPETPLFKIDDRRVYKFFGEVEVDGVTQKAHYFENIVTDLLPDLDANREDDIVKDFVSKIKGRSRDE
ncbi:SIR2 family protein [Porticoccus sp. GXU_MW_L64]